MPQKFANRAVSTLQAGINNSVTSLAVAGPAADLYPVADTGTSPVNTGALTWFKAMIIDSSGNYEIVHVRTRTGGSATFSNVIRGQDGTTAQSFSAGASVICYITAADAEASLSHPGVATGAHAATAISNTPAGNIVATTVQAAINELDSEKLAASAVSVFGATLIDDVDASAAQTTMNVPSRIGAGASGNWSINAATATSATSSTTATNIAGGGAGQEPYQSGSGATAMLGAGTAGQIKQSGGTGAPSWVDKITINSSVATTSGTIVSLTTSIPSTAKRVSLFLSSVSTNGTALPLIQLGDSGGIEGSGYTSLGLTVDVLNTQQTFGFGLTGTWDASYTLSGEVILSRVNTSNTWQMTSQCDINNQTFAFGTGRKTLSGTLDRISITTFGDTDTLDAGSVVVTWE